MKVILDTNVLLISISKKSPYRPIFQAVIDGNIDLVLSNEVLSEYTEIIGQRSSPIIAANIVDFLVKSIHVEKIDVFYKWKLITKDPDDNKFVDCAIAGAVDYLVTNDKHFDVLSDIPFP